MRRAEPSPEAIPLSQIGVAIVPGSITATWIPHGRSSRRSVSVKPSSANFEAA